jgi:hypothetical protein
LQVGLRSAPGGCREPPRQGATAQPELCCQLADLDRLVEVRVDVLLDLVDDQIVVEPSR